MLSLPYTTQRDQSLPHQVVLFVSDSRVHVSCNCQIVSYNSHTSIGISDGDLNKARAFYNTPSNHKIPFTKEDEAKW